MESDNIYESLNLLAIAVDEFIDSANDKRLLWTFINAGEYKLAMNEICFWINDKKILLSSENTKLLMRLAEGMRINPYGKGLVKGRAGMAVVEIDKMPTKEDAAEVLRQLISGKITRENASDWANPWMLPEKADSIGDYDLYHCLECLSAADMISTDRPYLYGTEDFESWLQELVGKHSTSE